MPEEVLFESERRQSREDIAEYLRTVAKKEAGETITLRAASDSVSLEVPPQPTFEVKAEREGTDPNTELSIEFELEWKENEESGESSDLTIE
ncbi:amphi-Trp domain-containing protein [Halocatena marina]|uniref:Amphi-Trp domain-containing protein n=1 Tax=Halocatena marina TaxID=2934937 RepID=A0ABD5YNF3_9EURY